LLLKQGELTAKQQELLTRMAETEQAVAEAATRGDQRLPQKTAGELVTEALEAEGVNGSYRGKVRVSVPRAAITSIDQNTNSIVFPDQRPGIVMGAFRQLTVRDLVAPGQTSSNSVEYVRETGFTNNAAPISENPTGTKP